MDSEIPSWCALTAVAPIVRFNAFEIFATPTLFLASDFISRSSDEVHARRTIAFFLELAFLVPYFGERTFYHTRFTWQCAICADLAEQHCVRRAVSGETVEASIFSLRNAYHHNHRKDAMRKLLTFLIALSWRRFTTNAKNLG